jgi:hypothetical protein
MGILFPSLISEMAQDMSRPGPLVWPSVHSAGLPDPAPPTANRRQVEQLELQWVRQVRSGCVWLQGSTLSITNQSHQVFNFCGVSVACPNSRSQLGTIHSGLSMA